MLPSVAGSPSLVPFHEAAVVKHKNAEYHDGLVANLPGNRAVEVWRVKDSTGYLVRILAPTTDGKRSLLKFGLTQDAAHALHDTLCGQIRRENS